MKLFPFNALLARMKQVPLCDPMKPSRPESLSEHTADTALLAHTLALISLRILHVPEDEVRPEQLTVAALYHDAPQLLLDRLPLPAAYRDAGPDVIRAASWYESAEQLLRLAPDALQADLRSYLSGAVLTPKERQLLKAAELLATLLKDMEEAKAGHPAFQTAQEQHRTALRGLHCPEADYFAEHMLPCCTMDAEPSACAQD